MVWNKMLYQRISLANSTSKYQVPRAHCGCRATNIQFTGQPASLNNLLYPRALHGWARSRVNQKKKRVGRRTPLRSRSRRQARVSLSLSLLWCELWGRVWIAEQQPATPVCAQTDSTPLALRLRVHLQLPSGEFNDHKLFSRTHATASFSSLVCPS